MFLDEYIFSDVLNFKSHPTRDRIISFPIPPVPLNLESHSHHVATKRQSMNFKFETIVNQESGIPKRKLLFFSLLSSSSPCYIENWKSELIHLSSSLCDRRRSAEKNQLNNDRPYTCRYRGSEYFLTRKSFSDS